MTADPGRGGRRHGRRPEAGTPAGGEVGAPAGRRAPLPAEAELARRWAAQAGAEARTTLDGTPLTVAFPGRPGGGAGPDFRDAVIRLGDGPPRVGDVELHRDARDFARHGHAADPAYDRVLLHVVFDPGPDEAAETPLASGRRAPVLALPAAAASAAPLREPCAAACSRMGRERVQAVLRAAGMWRLHGKAAALAARIERDGPDQALYAALAVALGQTANAAPFALLAEQLPVAALLDELTDRRPPHLRPAPHPDQDALLPAVVRIGDPLGAPAQQRGDGGPGPDHRSLPDHRLPPPRQPDAGPVRRGANEDGHIPHYPAPRQPDAGGALDAAVARVERRLLHAAGLDGALLAPAPALPWKIHGLRPAASPARRIRALARLVAGLSSPGLTAGARDLVARARTRPRLLVDTLAVRDGAGAALCGRSRAVEVAVNALLPWATACAGLGGEEEAAAGILVLADWLPAAERYGAIAHLYRNLCDGRGRPLITSALQQQGALAMLGQWCRRGGCGRCPLS